MAISFSMCSSSSGSEARTMSAMRRRAPVLSWYWRRAPSPVMASMRRTPAEMLPS